MAVELSQTSCVDLTGDFQNQNTGDQQGQEQTHSITGYERTETLQDNSSEKFTVNGNLSGHQTDNTGKQISTMPDCATQSQDIHQSNQEDNITITPSTESSSGGTTSPLSSNMSDTSSSTSGTSPVSTGTSSSVVPQATEGNSSASPATASSLKDAEVNMNITRPAQASTDVDDVTNDNKADCGSGSVDEARESVEGQTEEEKAEEEDELHDIIIPVPALPRTQSPGGTTNTKSNRGQRAATDNQPQKRRHLVRRPTPAKIETPTKLLNKLKMASSSFTEEEEEEETGE